MDYSNPRDKLVDWVRTQLIGPTDGENVLSGVTPLERYPTGILYPINLVGTGIDPAPDSQFEQSGISQYDDEESELSSNFDDDSEVKPLAQSARRRRYVPPSSMGFSIYVIGDIELEIHATAVHYKAPKLRDDDGKFLPPEKITYERSIMALSINLKSLHIRENQISKTNDSMRIDVHSRQFKNGQVITISLSNCQELPNIKGPREWKKLHNERALFETELQCQVVSGKTENAGKLLEYPRVDFDLLSEEEQDFEIQYRKRKIFAVGHGVAVDWNVESSKLGRVWTEFMPSVTVPVIVHNEQCEQSVLEIRYLSETVWDNSLRSKLTNFVTEYKNWIRKQAAQSECFREDFERITAMRICDKMNAAATRMSRGIKTLNANPRAAESFRLANQAMLNQMARADAVSKRSTEAKKYRWRPFQLAFLLAVVESTINENSDERDLMDLIWFPTGGGKTEAYLALIALLVVWRRLEFGDSGGGTVALMRYSLRLLTVDQFNRAVRMMCALELIRRSNPEKLGTEPFDVGLWVGKQTSPNSYTEVKKIIENEELPYDSLILKKCPWCDSSFDKDSYLFANDRFIGFACSDSICEFGSDPEKRLPANVVDEALYANPPSLLIATVDKFARLAWEGRAVSLFGNHGAMRPPELVIQDELHLITGPLGSVAGLYEAALETVLTRNGVQPKYVASTATISMAREQVKRLYGRKLAVFPPPGLSCEDSYFAHTDTESPGRKYIGHLTHSFNQRTCLSPLSSAVLMAPERVFLDDVDKENLLEAWWTQVIYHRSLRDVGYNHTNYMTEIRKLVRLLYERALPDELAQDANTQSNSSRMDNLQIVQLTSAASASENYKTFDRLSKRRDEEDYLDVVLATNMFSVGVDVQRLAVMIVHGQPMTTAEYIQATSRVGRGDVPGLVFVNYFRNQARSLSHYENFRPYHDSFYRFVEPTSVTPFTKQVRNRALHACLVISVRHAIESMNSNDAAGNFNRNNSQIKAVVDELRQRLQRACDEEFEFTDADITTLIEHWHDEAVRCSSQNRSIHYSADDKGTDSLLSNFDEFSTGVWQTMHSMRNIESVSWLKCNE